MKQIHAFTVWCTRDRAEKRQLAAFSTVDHATDFIENAEDPTNLIIEETDYVFGTEAFEYWVQDNDAFERGY